LTLKVEVPEPTWPSKNFDELLDIAFGKRRIASADDLLLRQLRGEV
jgi:hypothetical protein